MVSDKAKFYLWLEQEGGGCDYTIGCGLRLIALEATTLEEAETEAIREVGDGRNEERRTKTALVIEAVRVERVDVRAHYLAEEAKRLQRECELTEARERAELARLQKKFSA
jgi:hypothetical protein